MQLRSFSGIDLRVLRVLRGVQEYSETEPGAYLHASGRVGRAAHLTECLARDVRARNVRIIGDETGRWQRVVQGTIVPDRIVQQVEHAHPEREPRLLTERDIFR